MQVAQLIIIIFSFCLISKELILLFLFKASTNSSGKQRNSADYHYISNRLTTSLNSAIGSLRPMRSFMRNLILLYSFEVVIRWRNEQSNVVPLTKHIANIRKDFELSRNSYHFFIILRKNVEYLNNVLDNNGIFPMSPEAQECAEEVPEISDVFPRFPNSFPRVFRWGYKRLKSCFCAFFLCNFAVPRSHFRSNKLCYTKVLSQ